MFACDRYFHTSIASSHSPKNHTPHGSQRRLTETEQKTQSVFSSVQDTFLTACHSIASFFNSDIYKGKLLTRTQNKGKSSDALEYDKFKHNPYKVPDATVAKLAEYGCEMERPSYLDPQCTQLAPKQGVLLSPKRNSGGQCEGGVSLFIKKSLSNENSREIAEEFKNGIPIEGVLQHELYEKIGNEKTLDGTLLEMWDEKRGYAYQSLENKPSEIVDDENPRQARILSAYSQYLDEKQSHPTSQSSLNAIQWVDNYLQAHHQPTLDASEKTTLFSIDSRFQYGVDFQSRVALEVQDLEIESSLPKGIHDGGKPDAVLNSVVDLTPGAYKLSFPCYDQWGKQEKVNHTIALIVNEDGSTIFYDPNYSITEVSKENRQQTVNKVFKHYTGYSASGKNTLFRKIKHIWHGHANPPKNYSDLTGFQLLKIKLA